MLQRRKHFLVSGLRIEIHILLRHVYGGIAPMFMGESKNGQNLKNIRNDFTSILELPKEH
jgi:hypothetical protein